MIIDFRNVARILIAGQKPEAARKLGIARLLGAVGLSLLSALTILPTHVYAQTENGWILAQNRPDSGSRSEPGAGRSADVAAKERKTSPVRPTARRGPVQRGTLSLRAYLTSEGGVIGSGLIWRVFKPVSGDGAELVVSSHLASPTLQLSPGRYIVNAAFGRAYLTRVLNVRDGRRTVEKFVINAGGLRVKAQMAGGSTVTPGSVTYAIFSDERDQNGNRRRILARVRPGLVIRLNSGIYQIVSSMGDANARVEAEVTVEAGKLTEATIVHDAGKATFKLVSRAGGEALADTQWIILSASGAVIKESAGALPTHILAPGSYSVSARLGNKLYTRSFSIRTGENVEVEVVIQ